MAIVYGQIETLKRIRETLSEKGISRFNSTGQIKSFVNDYENLKNETIVQLESDYEIYVNSLQEEKYQLTKNFNDLKYNLITSLNRKRRHLRKKINALFEKPCKNFIQEFIVDFKQVYALILIFIISKFYKFIVWFKTRKAKKFYEKSMVIVNSKWDNRQNVLENQKSKRLGDLAYTKSVVDELYPLIPGAIGENKVLKELRKLPDDVIVINDFSLKFHKPIYNQKENDYIYNVQIDHLLITKAGVFIIETKNWSKRSVNSTYLWSPIKQIKRASYALFIVLNNWMESHYQDSIGHHWGTIQIPIKNMLVMVKNKPKEQFKFVAVKNINELNGYVNYFDPIFSKSQVAKIAEYLRGYGSMNNAYEVFV